MREISIIEINARMETLENQRNEALAREAILSGTIAALNEENAVLKARIEELEKDDPGEDDG